MRLLYLYHAFLSNDILKVFYPCVMIQEVFKKVSQYLVILVVPWEPTGSATVIFK